MRNSKQTCLINSRSPLLYFGNWYLVHVISEKCFLTTDPMSWHWMPLQLLFLRFRYSFCCQILSGCSCCLSSVAIISGSERDFAICWLSLRRRTNRVWSGSYLGGRQRANPSSFEIPKTTRALPSAASLMLHHMIHIHAAVSLNHAENHSDNFDHFYVAEIIIT